MITELSTSEQIMQMSGEWSVLHTRSRNEKRVAMELTRRNVPHYLPLLRVRHRYTKSTAEFDVPLFPGYVFVCASPEVSEQAGRLRQVASVIPVPDQAQLATELSQVARALESPSEVEWLPRIEIGKRYRVMSGPLAGLEGVVVRHQGRCRVCVGVTMLGQSAVVEVDALVLEAVG